MLEAHARRALRIVEDDASLFPEDRAGVVALLARLGELAPTGVGAEMRREVRGIATGLAAFYGEGELLGRARALAAGGTGLSAAERDSLRALLRDLDAAEARAEDARARARQIRRMRPLRVLAPRPVGH